MIDPDKINVILVTDCGSTTSKARFFRKTGSGYRYVASGEAPTTVEAPFEDVTVGVRNAVREVEEMTQHSLLDERGTIMSSTGGKGGVDIYCTTSSAGGGLQMMVTGVVKTMTGESAERAALGAGAIVMDVMAVDDGREPYEKIERMRFLRPDMILISGGTDGGEINKLAEIAQLVRSAEPKPRLGIEFKLPIVYAGNSSARKLVRETLGDGFELETVDNIRPTLDVENTAPAREAIHQFFLKHVMSHAPGYDKLMTWTAVPIMPTPMGEGHMFQVYARSRNANVIGVGLGGATTNIYSVYDDKFVRTVSANLGMSYSICNVLKETGIDNIVRWLPYEADEDETSSRLVNKMMRPTTIPQTLADLMLEHAVAREAIHMAFLHHMRLARPLLGTKREATAENIGDSVDKTQTYIDMMNIDSVGGTGGLLSHAPRRIQAMLILIDGFRVEGVTRLFQDSVFMMPHLGVLSTIHEKAALEIFENDCLVRLGTCITLSGNIDTEESRIAEIALKMPDGHTIERSLVYGEIMRVPLGTSEVARVEIAPRRPFDVGRGPGRQLVTDVEGGNIGIIIDARGRPLQLPDNDKLRITKLLGWFKDLALYPDTFFAAT